MRAVSPLEAEIKLKILEISRYDGQLEVEHYYLNSMWFIMVTFMSIGYGDIVPNTYCGRCLSITTGIVVGFLEFGPKKVQNFSIPGSRCLVGSNCNYFAKIGALTSREAREQFYGRLEAYQSTEECRS